MRRRLALVSLAVASLVVIAFLIPLAILVRNQAENRALNGAERDAQSIAAALAVAGSGETGSAVSTELAQAVLDAFGGPEGISIIFPDRTFVGTPVIESQSLQQARGGLAFTARTGEGAEVLVPVLLADSPVLGTTIVVRAFVPDAELSRGVATAWMMLGALEAFLVVVAVIAADRLGRSVVEPVTALSRAARSLGRGDLDTRVQPEGPEEIADVGEAFNFLAGRLGTLLAAERESVADLSHRLRTPLTALRLQAETLRDPLESVALLEDIVRVEEAVDRMIVEARRPSRDGDDAAGLADLAAVVRHRAAFWKVLADKQQRSATVEVERGSLLVPLQPEELGALVDTLIENVFAHTPAGVGYSVIAQSVADAVTLTVEDHGQGFADGERVVERGTSSGGSTGLGLDIVRRTATRTGGHMTIGTSSSGGARVEVVFGRAPHDQDDVNDAQSNKGRGPVRVRDPSVTSGGASS